MGLKETNYIYNAEGLYDPIKKYARPIKNSTFFKFAIDPRIVDLDLLVEVKSFQFTVTTRRDKRNGIRGTTITTAIPISPFIKIR